MQKVKLTKKPTKEIKQYQKEKMFNNWSRNGLKNQNKKKSLQKSQANQTMLVKKIKEV